MTTNSDRASQFRSLAVVATLLMLAMTAASGAGASAVNDTESPSPLRPAEPVSVMALQDGGGASVTGAAAGRTVVARGLTPFFIFTEMGFTYGGELQPLKGLKVCLRKTESAVTIECQQTDQGGAIPGFNLPQPGGYDLDVTDPQNRILDFTHVDAEVPWINPFTLELMNFEIISGGLTSQCDGEAADFIGSDGKDELTYAGFPKGSLAQLKVGSVVQWHAGDDVVSGGSGKDRWCGGPGDDRITGNGNDDYLVGGAGNDVLIGGKGNDQLLGGPGKDKLLGRQGNDVMVGGTGRDTCKGGKGSDTKNSC